MPAVRTPGAPQPTRRVAVLGFCLPLGETGSATPITFDFGAITPFTCVPACNLSVYASQWLLPDTTQDSIRSCPAQALLRSPSQATELNALARRNPHRTGRKPLDLSGSCHPLKAAAFRRDPGLLRLPVGLPISPRVTRPLRSTGITPLHHYYGAVRAWPAPRYFQPRGVATCAFSLTIADQGLKFRARARIRVTPPVHRTRHGQ